MNVREDVRQFIIENFLFGQEKDLRDGASLIDQDIIDSTGILELVGFLEGHFGIIVGDADLVPENLDTINALATFVERQMSAMKGAV